MCWSVAEQSKWTPGDGKTVMSERRSPLKGWGLSPVMNSPGTLCDQRMQLQTMRPFSICRP